MPPIVLDDHHRARGQQLAARQLSQDPVGLLDVGGIEEDPREALALAGQPAQRGADLGADDARAILEPQLAQVAAEGDQRLVIALDEDRATGAARQRLEAQRAGPGVEIEHAASGGGPRMLKIASRTFAAVGRVWAPRGAEAAGPDPTHQ